MTTTMLIAIPVLGIVSFFIFLDRATRRLQHRNGHSIPALEKKIQEQKRRVDEHYEEALKRVGTCSKV